MKILLFVSFLVLMVVFHVNAQYPSTSAPQIQSKTRQIQVNSTSSEENTDSLKGPWDHLTINSDSRINKLLEIRKEECIRKKDYYGKPGMDGFRIQIFQGPKDKADLIRSRFLSKYPEIKSYPVFQTPDFKVRVGDFRERSEALRVKYIIEKDFPNLIIVEDVICFPELRKEN